MHCHSRHSFDSLSLPQEIVRAARDRGLDRLVITDHNEIDGALILREMAPELIIVGEEVKTRERVDIIGIFLYERIPAGTPALETCRRIHEQGGVVYIPHPFDRRRAGGGRLLADLSHLIDAVEVHNARTRVSLNRRAESWAETHAKPKGAGSDAHTIREIGRGYVEVPPFDSNRESFLAALRAGTIAGRASSSPLVRLASGWARVRKRFPGA
jgi:predicted metal-dependent phosphoesterase TrpH